MRYLLRQPVVVSVDEAEWIYAHPERCEHCHHLLIFKSAGYIDGVNVCAVCEWEGCHAHGD